MSETEERSQTKETVTFSSISDDKKVEILNDHYKDTCYRLNGYRKQRNRLAFYSALTIGISMFLQTSSAENLPIVLSFLTRVKVEHTKTWLDSVELAALVVSTLPILFLTTIALFYKHYRIAMDNQFTYLQLLEAELSAVFPKSKLFKRETKFSSMESQDYSMWGSKVNSKLLMGGCAMLLIVHAITPQHGVFLPIIKCLMCGYCFYLFRSRKPLRLRF